MHLISYFHCKKLIVFFLTKKWLPWLQTRWRDSCYAALKIFTTLEVWAYCVCLLPLPIEFNDYDTQLYKSLCVYVNFYALTKTATTFCSSYIRYCTVYGLCGSLLPISVQNMRFVAKSLRFFHFISNTAILLVDCHLYSFRTGLKSLSFFSLRYVFSIPLPYPLCM